MLVSRSLRTLASVCLLLAACSAPPDAQEIVDEAIEAHGGERFESSVIDFDFRNRHFSIRRDRGQHHYERTYDDSLGLVREVLSNDSLYREIDGNRVMLTRWEAHRLQSSINSVVYFALLPYRLNDPGVSKRYLGSTRIDGEPYYKIEVTLEPREGGGDEGERFVYWFHRQRKTMDYLAYSYQTNGGGTRFREVINPRVVDGIRFADHVNLTSDTLSARIEDYDRLVGSSSLREVSRVVLENIRVRPLPDES